MFPEAGATIHATEWSNANQAQGNLESVPTMRFSHVIAIATRTNELIAINDYIRSNAFRRLIVFMFSCDSFCLGSLSLRDVARQQ